MRRTTWLRALAALLLAVALVWFWGRYALFPAEMTTGNARFIGWGLALLAGFGSYRLWLKAAELSEDGEGTAPTHKR
ncbi:hypothetical protein CWC38_01985 [Kocuria tytonicola]|uniref:Uncharacterized protein n=1 Tax=Kocuria tytonicola TaxID=2055946 RepID=A0A3L9LA52_9MICC|nr:hypothetical protein [Kocuria tytonicola]RLY93977.1 hypothetical protein EAE32_01670 [Kocuria tytonicola]RLZ04173.1 hypothetical protein CWC38_01985 [Kocuria tytonicola]